MKLLCPNCYDSTRVIDTRNPEGNYIVRTHECISCRYRIKTVEVVCESYEIGEIREFLKKIDEIKKK